MRRILATGRGGQRATDPGSALLAQGFAAILADHPALEFDRPETAAAGRPNAVAICAASPGPRPRGQPISTAGYPIGAMRAADGRLDRIRLRKTVIMSPSRRQQGLVRVIRALHAA